MDVPGRDARKAVRRGAVAGLRAAQQLQIAQHDVDADLTAYRYSFEGHIGDPAMPIDALVQLAIEASLAEELPGVVVVGEEVRRSLFVPKGRAVAVVDALDGTGPFIHLGSGYCCAILLLMRTWGGRWEVATCSIAQSGEAVVSLDLDRTVRAGLAGSDPDNDIVVANTLGTADFSLAVVGAKVRSRRVFASVMDAFPDAAAIYNLGGNPLTWSLVGGRLGCILAFGKQTSWDAIYVLIAACAGAAVATFDGRLVTRDEIISWFEELDLGEDVRTIPPVLVAKDPESLERVLSRAIEVMKTLP